MIKKSIQDVFPQLCDYWAERNGAEPSEISSVSKEKYWFKIDKKEIYVTISQFLSIHNQKDKFLKKGQWVTYKGACCQILQIFTDRDVEEIIIGDLCKNGRLLLMTPCSPNHTIFKWDASVERRPRHIFLSSFYPKQEKLIMKQFSNLYIDFNDLNLNYSITTEVTYCI